MSIQTPVFDRELSFTLFADPRLAGSEVGYRTGSGGGESRRAEDVEGGLQIRVVNVSWVVQLLHALHPTPLQKGDQHSAQKLRWVALPLPSLPLSNQKGRHVVRSTHRFLLQLLWLHLAQNSIDGSSSIH